MWPKFPDIYLAVEEKLGKNLTQEIDPTRERTRACWLRRNSVTLSSRQWLVGIIELHTYFKINLFYSLFHSPLPSDIAYLIQYKCSHNLKSSHSLILTLHSILSAVIGQSPRSEWNRRYCDAACKIQMSVAVQQTNFLRLGVLFGKKQRCN